MSLLLGDSFEWMVVRSDLVLQTIRTVQYMLLLRPIVAASYDLLLPAGVLLAAGVLAAGCCGSTYRYVVSCIKTITRELGKSFPNITINLLY